LPVEAWSLRLAIQNHLDLIYRSCPLEIS